MISIAILFILNLAAFIFACKFGYDGGYRLSKQKAINKSSSFGNLIKAQNNPLLLEQWTRYLDSVSATSNDLSFREWLSGISK